MGFSGGPSRCVWRSQSPSLSGSPLPPRPGIWSAPGSAASPACRAFIACGTSDAEGTGSFNEIELIRWKVEEGGVRGSIRKSGVFVTKGQQIGACKGGWVRTSATDPAIAACP